MGNAQRALQADAEGKINEAEVCFSMGLFDEALVIFEQVLKDFPRLDDEQRGRVDSRIQDIREKLKALEQDEAGSVSSQEISMLRKSLSSPRKPTSFARLFRQLRWVLGAASFRLEM